MYIIISIFISGKAHLPAGTERPSAQIPGVPRLMKPKYNFLAILFIFAVLYLLLLGVRPLIMPDEARYVEIPREMLADRDYVTPRLNGLRYF